MIVNRTSEEGIVIVWTIEITYYQCGKHLRYRIVFYFAKKYLFLLTFYLDINYAIKFYRFTVHY